MIRLLINEWSNHQNRVFLIMKGRLFLVLLLFYASLGFTSIYAQLGVKRELRAAWVATVANIDWPRKGCSDSYEQQSHMIEILDSLKTLKFNAIIFQVRPTSDALYDSKLEPWSKWLTGKQGVSPEPYYDPLSFVVAEAHKRQIDVHVWLNPYRVVLREADIDSLSPDHIYNKRPELFVKYGTQYYFNPGLDETREYLNRVVADVVSRYDIDAIHFDDYFYPYRIAGQEFPDRETFVKFPRGFKNINDWRRNNVDMVIRELSHTIHSRKPWVEFGISPFGVWRNKDRDVNGSRTRAGQTNYDDLYADVRLWLQKGWIDYVMPQLYWEIGKTVADYLVLSQWWVDNSFGRNLYIGISSSNIGVMRASAWHRPNELVRQMRVDDSFTSIKGEAFFSCRTLLENRQGLCDSLSSYFYKYDALTPMNTNIQGGASAAPDSVRIEKWGSRNYLVWNPVEDYGGYQVRHYVVYMFSEFDDVDLSMPSAIVAQTDDTCVDLTKINTKGLDNVVFVIASVNRYHHESVPSDKVVLTCSNDASGEN